MRINIEKYGMYILRAVSDKGKIRCAWVRCTNISDKLTPPEIAYTSEKPESGWRNSNEVKLELTTDSPSVTEIHYILTGRTEKGEQAITGKTASDTITNKGLTKITAWTVDEKGYTSEIVEKEITIHKDITEPDTVIIALKSNTANSITVIATGNDNESEVAGYIFEYRPSGSESSDWILHNLWTPDLFCIMVVQYSRYSVMVILLIIHPIIFQLQLVQVMHICLIQNAQHVSGNKQVSTPTNCTHQRANSHWRCEHGEDQTANYHT